MGKAVGRFLKYHEKLVDIYVSKKKMTMLPVKINGADFNFSVGKHNELQKVIIEELAWETEVWIAELPEHMIHLNGDKFMGPR